MPCVNRRRAAEHERRLAAERVDVNRFAGIDDPVEILLRIHRPPPHDERKNYLPYPRPTADVYRALSQADVERLVAVAAGDRALLCDVATHLASFSSCDLTTCQDRLLDGGDPYPRHAFRGASDLVVQRLLATVDALADSGSVVLEHALGALAWSRSLRAEQAQRRWRDMPPAWRDALNWPPERFALDAGYEVEGNGRRELVLPSAYKLSADRRNASTGGGAVFEPDPSGKTCPQCGLRATSLLRIDALPADVSLSLEGDTPSSSPGSSRLATLRSASLGTQTALHVPTCIECVGNEQVFVRLSDDPARWEWLAPRSASQVERTHRWELPPTPVILTPRPPWAAVDWCIAEGISQLGGHPSRINDPTYPPCPTCSRTMLSVAQVAPEDFVGLAEGVFYVHLCPRCKVVGVSYDQT
jgi:hypothetical protein